jgi:hypothetical protein
MRCVLARLPGSARPCHARAVPLEAQLALAPASLAGAGPFPRQAAVEITAQSRQDDGKSTNQVGRSTMDRSCDNCRHFHAMLSADLNEHFGTCHRNPPRLVPFELGDLDDRRADAEEMRRWPAVFCGDLCGKHEWRCEARDCREPARQHTLGDTRLYCYRHWARQPSGRSVFAA